MRLEELSGFYSSVWLVLVLNRIPFWERLRPSYLPTHLIHLATWVSRTMPTLTLTRNPNSTMIPTLTLNTSTKL